MVIWGTNVLKYNKGLFLFNFKQLFTNEICLEDKVIHFIKSLLKISIKPIGSIDVFITTYGFRRKTVTSLCFFLLFLRHIFFLVHYCVLPLGHTKSI